MSNKPSELVIDKTSSMSDIDFVVDVQYSKVIPLLPV